MRMADIVLMADRDLEDLARAVRRMAGLSDDELPTAPVIVARVLGPDTIQLVPELHGYGYLQRTEDGSFRILVRPDRPDLNFTIAHELGHWALRELAGFQGEVVEEERAANYLAGAILAPPPMVHRAHSQWGEKVRTIARAFGVSQTAMVLRLAEVRQEERAVVTRTGNVLARGMLWSRVPVVDIARGDRRWRGLAKATLRGGIDDGRIALRVK
jgi:Zn-dependent peptidase ImmA (M78 family)